MTRRQWDRGLSRLTVAGFILQGVALAVVLGATAVLVHSGGWFDDLHDHALLWDDAAVAVGLICGIPLTWSLIRKRSSAVAVSIVLTVSGCVTLLDFRPARG